MPGGRPPKIGQPHPGYTNRTIGDGIIVDLTAGIFKNDAAGRAGIAVPTLYNWLDRGRDRLAALHTFDREHPDSLDCPNHTWRRNTDKTCRHCGVARAVWEHLQHDADREAPYVEFLEGCSRAQAEAKSRVQGDLLAAMRASPRVAVVDADGNPVVVNGQIQTQRMHRGDWRAAAWWLERIDPEQFHLPTRTLATAESDANDEQSSPRELMDAELAELAQRIHRADQLRAETAARGGT